MKSKQNILELNKSDIFSRSMRGESIASIANIYFVHHATMCKFFKKYNIKIRRKKLSEQDEINLIKKYKNGIKSTDLSKEFHISNSVVLDYLKYNNVIIRDSHEYIESYIDKKFFETLTDESLWTLGWFYSDGCINKKTNQVSITVQTADIDALEKISKLLKLNKNRIYKTKKNNIRILYLCNKKIHNDLILLGCIPNKSLIIEYPKFFIENWQHWAFLRGIWEGDGHISIHKKSNTSFMCMLSSGSLKFLQSVQKILKEKLNIDSNITERINSNSKRLAILGGSKQIIKFLDLIYQNKNCKNYLDRKYKIYLDMKNRCDKFWK